jgi:site-specific DNA-adenine methylase
MLPFFCYFGGKYRAAPHYPAPRYPTIIEPFAGAAGYATRYADCDVRLYDVDPIIVGVWSYLIKAKASEIRAMPTVVEHVDNLRCPQEAKWLIGFWLNKGTAAPCKTPSAWMRAGTRGANFWGPQIRERVATQSSRIKHWKCEQKSYREVETPRATWFVDPPYVKAGRNYRYSDVDYADLASWCRLLTGQAIVCEAEGADWLPFRPFRTIKASEARSGGKRSHEVIWTGRFRNFSAS